MTTIKLNTHGYSTQRFGIPWIARVNFATKTPYDFTMGQWVGEEGEPGLLTVDCEEGGIVVIGQEDFSRPENSADDWFQVREGKLEYVGTASAAYKLTCK